MLLHLLDVDVNYRLICIMLRASANIAARGKLRATSKDFGPFILGILWDSFEDSWPFDGISKDFIRFLVILSDFL